MPAILRLLDPALFLEGLEHLEDRLPVALAAQTVVMLGYPARGAHAEHDIFDRALERVYLLILVDYADLLVHAVNILLEILDEAVADIADAAVRAGAEAHIIVHVPILQIVLGLIAGSGKVGYFILLIAVTLKHLGGVGIHIRLRVVVREDRGAVILLVHPCARFELQPVA